MLLGTKIVQPLITITNVEVEKKQQIFHVYTKCGGYIQGH